MKKKYLIYFLIFTCIFWMIYPLVEKEPTTTLFLLDLLASPAGIFICYKYIKNTKNTHIYENIIFYYFLTYGLLFLSIDIYNMVNKITLITDFGLTSDITVIYCAIKVKYKGLWGK